MSINVRLRPFSSTEAAILLVTRVLTATLLTALVGAVENWLYELVFAPDLYAAGNPFARGVFMLVVTFPYILAGLVLLGLPTAYGLRHLRSENVFTYGLAGVVTGAAWGAITLSTTAFTMGVAAFYGCVCALSWWWLRPRG